jgi:hypothetical protein
VTAAATAPAVALSSILPETTTAGTISIPVLSLRNLKQASAVQLAKDLEMAFSQRHSGQTAASKEAEHNSQQRPNSKKRKQVRCARRC